MRDFQQNFNRALSFGKFNIKKKKERDFIKMIQSHKGEENTNL